MPNTLILASGSATRAHMLTAAGVQVEICPARIDEDAIRAALLCEQAAPRDVADALAEIKARKISDRRPDVLVLGSDQVLEFNAMIYTKPDSQDDAREQLRSLRGKTHRLLSAAVIYQDGQPVWRHVGVVRMTMHDISDDYLYDYVERNWQSIRDTVGCYKVEEEGVRLFSRIEGDYFSVLGMPLIEVLNWLRLRGEIAA